jgi:pimeloyl-ACP methyl ester carboxylesterase
VVTPSPRTVGTPLLETLASNHTVIVFDNRGIGNTTSGSEQKFSISLFANDTAGLLEALNIKKADVLAWSMGGRIAQELTLNYPDRVVVGRIKTRKRKRYQGRDNRRIGNKKNETVISKDIPLSSSF